MTQTEESHPPAGARPQREGLSPAARASSIEPAASKPSTKANANDFQQQLHESQSAFLHSSGAATSTGASASHSCFPNSKATGATGTSPSSTGPPLSVAPCLPPERQNTQKPIASPAPGGSSVDGGPMPPGRVLDSGNKQPGQKLPPAHPMTASSTHAQQEQKQPAPPPRIVYDLPPSGNKHSVDAPQSYGNNSSSNGGGSSLSGRNSGVLSQQDDGGAVGNGCCLDAADSHIDLEISPDGLRASCLHTDGFQYTWKGVRSTYGVRGSTSQYYFEVKVVGCPSVVMPETPAATQNVCRIGVSQPFTSLFLGESGESWGYGGTAKKSNSRKFENYGQPYGLNDVVGIVIDLQNLKLSFTKNGAFLGTAYTLPARVRDTGLFPHLYLKNVDVEVNFCSATAWFPPPNKQIQFIGDVSPQALLPNGVEHPRHVGECEFIMMVGLPACGKTFWAERHCMQHPAKSYVLLGTNAVIDQMRVMGVKRQANYASRWEELMTTATAIFNALVARAGTGKNPRNIIIDQTNVYRNARRRKVQPFLAWGVRRAVTIVNDEATLQQRTQKREQEEGKFVPVAAVKEMEAAFCLPHLDDGFTVIEYPELPEIESRQQVRWYNEDGRRFKRENPNAMGNQTKPHMEKRRPEEFVAAGEMYPEKKRGRYESDDPQQRQGAYGSGGYGPGGGAGGSGQAGGWRDGSCYGGGGGRGREEQQHQGHYNGGRGMQQQQQQGSYQYGGGPRGGYTHPQQQWGGGGYQQPDSSGGGDNNYTSSYYAGGRGGMRGGGQGTGGYAAGGRNGGGGSGDYNMQTASSSGGGGNYYGDDMRGGKGRGAYHQRQQPSDGYYDGAAAGGGGGVRSYHVDSSGPSYSQRRGGAGTAAGRESDFQGGGGYGAYKANSFGSDGRGKGDGYGYWRNTAAGGPGGRGGDMCAGGGAPQQQRQSWGTGNRYRG